MSTKTISFEAFQDSFRDAVLVALDGAMREQTNCETALGSHDSDLPLLFAAIDAHALRVARRLNDPESEEVGSAYLTIDMDVEAAS